MNLSKGYFKTLKVTIYLIAILILCMRFWNQSLASAQVEYVDDIDKSEKESRVNNEDFWIIDIDAIGQRLFLRPLLFKRFKPETFTFKKAAFFFPEDVCPKSKVIRNLNDDVSILCVTRYLEKMMKNFIDLDSRRKGILSFDINIPFAIQSQYDLKGDDSENIRMYHLTFVYSYTQVNGIMIRSIEAEFIKELSSGDALKDNIQSNWNKQRVVFRGDNSYFGPPKRF